MNSPKEDIARLKERLTLAEATLKALQKGELDLLIGPEQPILLRMKSLEEAKERYQAMLELVHGLSRSCLHVQTREELAKKTMSCLQDSTLTKACWIILQNKEGRIIAQEFSPELNRPTENTLPDCWNKIMTSKDKAISLTPDTDCSTCRQSKGLSNVRIFCIKISFQEHVYGALVIYVDQTMAGFQEIITFLEQIAIDLGRSLFRMELREARDQAMQDLRQAKEDWKIIFQAIGHPTIILDREQHILAANNALLKKIHVSSVQELTGKKCYQILHGPGTTHPPSNCPFLRIKGGQASVEEEQKILDGTYLINCTPVYDQAGNLQKVIHVATDLTEIKNLEAQLAQAGKMEAIGRLSGGIAHDFNNLLNVIIGYAELAQSKVDQKNKVLEYLEQIRTAGERSSELTRQLLAFARKQHIAPEVVELNQHIQRSLKIYKRLLTEEIELHFTGTPSLHRIKIDPSQLDQILLNLVVNARDAITGPGKIIISTANAALDEKFCRQHPGLRPGNYISLKVSDSGQGIPPEIQNKIFDPFFTTKQPGKGTGMGLATIYGIIRQNQGLITVSSQPGQGAVFTVYLPAWQDAELSTQDKGQELALPKHSGTVLLVEDDPLVLALCEQLLTELNFEVHAFQQAHEVLLFCEQNQNLGIDLLLTDVIMPKMNGKELAEKILQFRPGLKTIFMSAYPADFISDQGDFPGKLYFLQKPFTKDKLTQKLNEIMDQAP